jgi:hypothetical protein
MDEEKKRDVKFVIKQYLGNNWAELITIDTEGPGTDEEIQKGLDGLRSFVFKGESGYMSTQETVIIFNRKDGPIRIDVVEKDA